MTLLARLEDALASIDVEGAKPDKLLGDDLGMDSQELLCAAVDLEKLFSVKIKDGELLRKMSVFDLALLISRKRVSSRPLGPFDYSLSQDITICAPFEAVYEGLFNFAAWPQKLPHVRSVNTRYDDGVFQEFDMEVLDGKGVVISVRSVRHCEPDRIRFFQPQPPKFARHHCGDWILTALDNNITHVVTRHEWRLAEAASEMFPDDQQVPISERVSTWLAAHARFALECWKSSLEKATVQ
jgi:acyl carrier protein